jgi:hypothetical protein
MRNTFAHCPPHRQASALLHSFFVTERLLIDGPRHSNGKIESEFEIVYTDGHQIGWHYRFARKETDRPALAQCVPGTALMHSAIDRARRSRAWRFVFQHHERK